MTKINQQFVGIGRRKTSVVRVILTPITSNSKIDKKDLLTIKNSSTLSIDEKIYILAPLKLIDKENGFKIDINTSGGGKTSRLDAIRLAIARALIKFDPELKTTLRKSGFLTRDPREKERKKPGLRRARRAPQWAKR